MKKPKVAEKEFKTAYIASYMATNGNSPREAVNAADRAWNILETYLLWGETQIGEE